MPTQAGSRLPADQLVHPRSTGSFSSHAPFPRSPFSPSTARRWAAPRAVVRAVRTHRLRGLWSPSGCAPIRAAAAATARPLPRLRADRRAGQQKCEVTRSLRQVFGPTTPSTANPFLRWKARTAPLVFGPYIPSTAPGVAVPAHQHALGLGGGAALAAGADDRGHRPAESGGPAQAAVRHRLPAVLRLEACAVVRDGGRRGGRMGRGSQGEAAAAEARAMRCTRFIVMVSLRADGRRWWSAAGLPHRCWRRRARRGHGCRSSGDTTGRPRFRPAATLPAVTTGRDAVTAETAG